MNDKTRKFFRNLRAITALSEPSFTESLREPIRIERLEKDKQIESGKRQTRFVRIGVKGVPGFTELVLTSDEEEKISKLKSLLVGTEVIFSQKAINRTNNAGEITDIRIIVDGYGRVSPCAIVEFANQGYSRLRELADIINANNITGIEASLLLIG